MFNKLAKDKDYLDEEDLERFIYLPRVLKTQAEYKSRATHRKFLLDDDGNLPTGPEPGALAPDFDLQSPDGATRVKLSSFRGKKPVVLIFGCLTCGNYRTYSNTLEKLYQRQKDQVEFLRVYVREAHPVDDHGPTPTNAKAGILIRQPASLEERCTVAGRCAADLHIQTPMVVDGLDNRVGQAYGGWPDRLYLIDREGRVVFQGGPGPFAFNPRELEQSLQLLLLDQEQRPSATR
jgi:thiol-disulfide isomerase/thioredoxin